ncbi:Ubiquitinyl hydrolase 1 [Entomophthora muscae]|uniref:Ubiquitinyl hydrolase 1 n=1 Tax=Entomophthora muscae TaxID=34485 RepID=A0ACC2UVI0_9FUNG|nr:Ubiquitinyl hydrolase 1 [Entomophthora muscae]
MSKNNQNKYNGKESTLSPRKSFEKTDTPHIPQMSERLAKHGMKRYAILGDGNCLFRALSHQLTGHENLHLQIREEICNYLEKHSAYFAPFSLFNEDEFKWIVDDMRTPGIYGGNAELAAFANLYCYTIRVFHNGSVDPIHIEPVSLTENNSDNYEPSCKHNGILNLVYFSGQQHYESTCPIGNTHTGSFMLDEDDDFYLSPYEYACKSDLLLSTIVGCLSPVLSDSDSEFKPKSLYNKESISHNVCNVMQQSRCEDKERIFDHLLEANNNPKKALLILEDEHKELLTSPNYSGGSSVYHSCSEGELTVYYDALTSIKCKASQESTKEPANLIKPSSTSNTLHSKLQPSSPIALSSYVSLKSSCRDEEEEKQISPKRAKSNNHSTPTEENTHLTKPVALIEPSSTSNIIPLKPQTTSPIKATRSSVSLKSSRQDEEEEKQISPKRAKSNNHSTPTEENTHLTKPVALIEPSSTSNIIPLKPQTTSPIKATRSSVSLKSSFQDIEEEKQISPKRAKSNNHGTPTEENTHLKKPVALIELSSTSNIIPLKLQTTSCIKATRSSVSLKSSCQDEEE